MRVNVNETVTEEKNEVQAKAYGRIVSSCMAVKRCVGIIVWVRISRGLLANSHLCAVVLMLMFFSRV